MKTILILSANPKNTNSLRLDEEVREIKKTIQLSPNRDEFQIVTESAVRVDDLIRFLSYHQPTILHFSGHGSGTDGLLLEDDYGHIQLVSTQALAKLFDLFQQQVECVLLNACYSEEQATAIHQHIDCVVGMSQAIEDKAAIKFSIGFYTALAAGRNYEDCFHTGCTSIDLQGIIESLTPTIKVRRRRYQPPHLINPVKSDKDDNVSNDNKGGQNRFVSVGYTSLNLAGILGGIAAIITAAGSIYVGTIQHNSNNIENPKDTNILQNPIINHGFDSPGNDLKGDNKLSYEECLSYCKGNHSCIAFYFVRGTGSCFLKERVGVLVKKDFEKGVFVQVRKNPNF